MRNKKASLGIDPTEIEANRFAAELLMPQFLVVAEISDKPVDVDDDELVEQLASQFRVSKQAMGHRLNSLLLSIA